MMSHARTRLIAIAAAAVLAAAALAATASATTMRTGSSTGPTYSGDFAATNVGNFIFASSSGVGTITCTNATMAGSVTSSGALTVSSATWTNGSGACTNNLGQPCTYTAQNLPWGGSIAFQSLSSTPNGTATFTGSPYAGFSMLCGSITCYYGSTSVIMNFNNPSGTTGSQLVENATISKQSGSGFTCSSSAIVTATYDIVTSPGGADLWVTA